MLDSLLLSLDYLRDTEHSVANWRFQIVLVDNSEADELNLADFGQLTEKLDAIDAEFRLIQGQGNVGYGTGQNLSMSNAHSGYHLVMNPDVELESTCLREGISYLRSNLDVAVASPLAVNNEGKQQYLCKRIPSILVLFLRGFMPVSIQATFRNRLAHYEMQDLSSQEPTHDVPIVSGCFMLCRNSALLEVAGFNEDYFLYFEDFDLSMRLSEKYSLAFVPSMRIVHFGGYAARKGIRHIYLFVRSAYRFFSTYGWRLV